MSVLNPNAIPALVRTSFWREGDSFENVVAQVLPPLSRDDPAARADRRLRDGGVLHARHVGRRDSPRRRAHDDVGRRRLRRARRAGHAGTGDARVVRGRLAGLLLDVPAAQQPQPDAERGARHLLPRAGRARRPRLRPAAAGPDDGLHRRRSGADQRGLRHPGGLHRAGHRRARDVFRHHAALGRRPRVGRLDVALDVVVHGGRGDRQLLQHLHPGGEPEQQSRPT